MSNNKTLVSKKVLRLQAIVEESHEAIIGKTLEGIIVSWNGGATKMFGYTRQEIIGKSLSDLFVPERKNELPQLLNKIKKGQTISIYDSIWIKKDGTPIDVEFSLSPVHSKNGLIIGSSLVGRDVSHEKEINEIKSTMIRDISHSISSPLSIVANSIDIILSELKKARLNKAKIRKYSEIIKRNIQLSLDDTNNITEFNSLEKNSTITEKSIDINNIIKKVLFEVKDSADLKNLKLMFRKQPVPKLKGDVRLLKNLIKNIVENAIKFTSKGAIEVSIKKTKNILSLSVKDTGIGIAKVDIKKLFEPFAKIDPSSKGVGLGLSISKKLASLHGASIVIDSILGEGTVVTISFPINKS